MSKPFVELKDFEKVFKQYYNPLCNFVNNKINNWEDSREVVQSTFLKIWENREKVEVHSSIKNYLYQAVRNMMIDHIRKKIKKNELEEELVEVRLHESSEELDPYLIRESIVKGMTKLKPKNKLIFELSKFEGLTYTEIATHLKISERSVEDNVARALKILKEELKTYKDFKKN